MSRATLWISAGVCLSVAIVLTLLGVGDQAGALPNWQALVLGLVQGATELLPISSSGHLILVPWLGDWQYLKEHDAFNQTFDVALHLGTLVAVVAYFWRDIVASCRRVVRGRSGRAGSRRARSGSPGSSSSRRSRPRSSALLGEDADRRRTSASRGRSRSCWPSSRSPLVADRQPQRRTMGRPRAQGGGRSGACADALR